MTEIERCRREQLRCADNMRDPQYSAKEQWLAAMGHEDWLREELILIRQYGSIVTEEKHETEIAMRCGTDIGGIRNQAGEGGVDKGRTDSEA